MQSEYANNYTGMLTADVLYFSNSNRVKWSMTASYTQAQLSHSSDSHLFFHFVHLYVASTVHHIWKCVNN